MSATFNPPPEAEPTPRVRELARESAVLMVFSLGISVALAFGLLLAVSVGR